MQVYKSRIGENILPLGYFLGTNETSKSGVNQSVIGFNPDRTKLQGFTFFECVKTEKAFPVLVSFLLGGVSPDVPSDQTGAPTALHIAAKHGNTLAMHFLLDNGTQVDSLTANNQTPLMWALQANQLDAVSLLLKRGANASATDSDGRSPVHFAMSNSLTLHALSSHVNLPSIAVKENLLHEVSKKSGSRFIALYLIEQCGCNVNLPDATGRTPLHYAALTGDLDLVKTLCSKGADLMLADASGVRPSSQPGVTKPIRNLLTQLSVEASNTGKERLTALDFSNLARVNGRQIQHFLVAFLVPNILLLIGSKFPLWIGFAALLGSAIGFTMVAQFGMAQRGRSMATAGWFSGALFFGGFIYVTNVLTVYSENRPGTWVPLLWWIATIGMFSCYARAVLMDPGVVSSTTEDRRLIYEAITKGGEAEIQSQGLDVTAMVRKPLRSKHCTKTEQCVYRFDHYCVWTGNAIGGGNHRYFVWYCMLQFCSQSLVSYATLVYLIFDAPAEPSYFDVLFGARNILITFFLVFYNTFVFLFVSSVVMTQLWFAARNVTSNEVWFPERYKWMFRLGSRAYCMFDEGFTKNMISFFWSGNLCAEHFIVPPMNEHLKAVSRKFAAQEKNKQLNANKNLMRNPEAMSYLTSQPAVGHEHLLDNPSPDKIEEAVAQLPVDVQQEMQAAQLMVQQMISTGNLDVAVPDNVSLDRREHVQRQARMLYSHFQAAMQRNLAGGSFQQPHEEPAQPTIASSAVEVGPVTRRQKRDD